MACPGIEPGPPEDLTDYDGLRGTFWPIKFLPPNFLMKSYFVDSKKLGIGEKPHLNPPGVCSWAT